MNEARLFLVVCSERKRSNDKKLVHRKFLKNISKNLFTIRVTEHWNRLSREVVESHSTEIFKIFLDAYLCNLLSGICFRSVVGLDDLLRSFPTPVIL